APRGGTQHAGQAVEEGALAGAVRPDDGADLALFHLKVDVAERAQPAEAHRHALGAQHVRRAFPGRARWEGRRAGGVSRHLFAVGQVATNLQAGRKTVLSFGTTSRILNLPSFISNTNSRMKAWWSSLRSVLSPCGKSSPSFISRPSSASISFIVS